MGELIVIEQNKDLQAIEMSKAVQIKAVFDPMAKRLFGVETDYDKILSESKQEITEDLTKRAKRLRLDIVKIRTETEGTRKKQKEEYLLAGKAIDGVANILKWAISSKEDELQKIEDHFENLKNEALKKLQEKRVDELSPYIDGPVTCDLAAMEPDVWAAYLSAKKKSYEDRIEAERKAKVEKEEQLRLDKLENERTLIILPYRDFWMADKYQLRESTQEEFESLVGVLKSRKDDYDKEQKNIKAENDRLKKEADERDRKAKLERDEKTKREKEDRDRIAKLEADAKKLRDAEDLKKKQEEDQLQNELKKGDSEKIDDLILDIESIKTKYQFRAEKNIKMYSDVGILIDRIIAHILK